MENRIKKMYTALARTYNLLDHREIEPFLAKDIRYTSQEVLQDLVDKHEVLQYLKAKFETIRKSNNPVFAELATMRSQREWSIQIAGLPVGEPCIILSQGTRENKGAIVLIQLNGEGMIRQIDICTVVPHWSTAAGTGIYPGLENQKVNQP